MNIERVEARERVIAVHWIDGTTSFYPNLFLRDNDQKGFHPQTGERQFDLLSVPLDLTAEAVTLDGDAVHIDWRGDNDRTTLAADWLYNHRPGVRAADPADIAAEIWEADLQIPRVSVDDLSEDRVFFEWLCSTKRHGLSVVTGLDDNEEAGVALGERIGFLRRTNFGLTFRVETIPDPNNLAYTSHALPLHTDLPNQEMPPGYQFLHCVRNGAEGGESVFADAYMIAEKVRRKDAEAFRLLTSIPIPYRFHDRQYDIRVHRPMVSVDERDRVFDVRYSAHLMDSFDIPDTVMADYYAAYRRFMAETRDPANIITFKMKPGEMVVFDNRRILHGRTAFDPMTGHRLLKGFYVDRGEFDSRIRLLAEQT
ncbi:TauD/TfdA family dioxygenase [Rhizobium laguerreae]|uniref:TauD/TfdA family dioxygenase n=1 Tax=Rhizobium laguerreae TaxID=1076926 RepID=UPI001441C2DC|nr:TauD/TfdA family dioxygenase [Rhizobium laguerreae]NKN05508.1 gamma-butyrobetaine hydroxylase [Rhizobium laguerreae]